MFATDYFGWIITFKFTDNDNALVQEREPILVPARICLKIRPLNDFQVVIQNLMGLTIVNFLESRVDFKFKFVDKYNFDISVSNGFVAIPRKSNGVLIDFGLDNEFDCDRKSEAGRLVF